MTEREKILKDIYARSVSGVKQKTLYPKGKINKEDILKQINLAVDNINSDYGRKICGYAKEVEIIE